MNAPRRSESHAVHDVPSRLRRVILLACALLASAAGSVAQTPADGALHGTVSDARNHPLGIATVALINTETGESRATAVHRDGTFLLPLLPPGSYALTIQTPGHASIRFQPLPISAQQTVQLRATIPGSPGKASIQLLSPSESDAATDTLPDENDDGLLTAGGLTPLQNASLVDGVSSTQSFLSVPVGTGSDPAPDPDSDSDSADLTTGPANGLSRGRHAGVAYTFSQSAVREFHVSGYGYSAQTGNAAGAMTTTISRTGTSTLHGSAAFTLRSEAFAAANPLSIASSYSNGIVSSALVKPHDLRENYAGTLGGPVPRAPATFFFYAFDGQRRGFPAISSPADPNFYALTSTQRSLLGNRGVTAAALNTALNNLSALTGSTPRRADQSLNFLRFDWRRHPRLNLSAEYNAVRWTSPAGLIDAPVVARGRASLGSASGSLDSVLLRATTSLSPRTTNQARVAFVRDLQYETPQTPLPQEPAISPGGLAPEVNIGPNGILFGTPASLSQSAYPAERRIELADTLTLTRGRHLLALGATVSFVHDTVATLSNAAGTFRYDSGVTRGYAGGLVDYLTDTTFNVNVTPNGACPAITATTHLFCFRSYSQSFGIASTAFSTQEWSGFLEDTWHPHPRLTFHAGARYEYTLLPIPANPNPTLDAFFKPEAATSVFPEDRNNIGPRAAIAWQPFGFGRGTIRLGYGLFFGRLPGATIRAALTDTAQASATTRIRILPTAITACPQVASQGFGYPCAFLAQPAGVVAQTTSAVLFDHHFRLPVVQQGSLTLERTLGRAAALSATYLLNLDRQLPTSTDLNIAPSTQTASFQLQGGTGAPGVQDGETFKLPLYTARLTPSFGPVTDILSNSNATYNALLLTAEADPARSLHLRAHYTWSKALDYGQAQSATPRTDGQLDPFTNGYDKGLSALNYPWAFHFTALWSPQTHLVSHFGETLIHDWKLAPILTARAGRPYTFDLSGGTRLPGGHESLNGSGGALYLPTVGRNTLRLPPTTNLDLRLARGFRSDRRVQLRASAEAFNLLNHRNISSVTQRAFLVGTAVSGVTPLVYQDAAAIAAEGLNTRAFGTPTAASTGLNRERQLQLSVRLSF